MSPVDGGGFVIRAGQVDGDQVSATVRIKPVAGDDDAASRLFLSAERRRQFPVQRRIPASRFELLSVLLLLVPRCLRVFQVVRVDRSVFDAVSNSVLNC